MFRVILPWSHEPFVYNDVPDIITDRFVYTPTSCLCPQTAGPGEFWRGRAGPASVTRLLRMSARRGQCGSHGAGVRGRYVMDWQVIPQTRPDCHQNETNRRIFKSHILSIRFVSFVTNQAKYEVKSYPWYTNTFYLPVVFVMISDHFLKVTIIMWSLCLFMCCTRQFVSYKHIPMSMKKVPLCIKAISEKGTSDF